MIGISVLALGLPLAGVAVFLTTFKPKPAEPAAPAMPDPQIAKTLEDISNKTLAPKALESGNREAIRLQVADPEETAAKVTRLASSVGGSAMPADAPEGQQRLWVSIPEKRAPAFTEACRGGVQELEYPAAKENEARVLIEIVVDKKAP